LSELDERQIQAQPERVRASRGRALAVLAVGAAVLIVLVGVLPRITGQPADVDSPPVAHAPETSPPAPPRSPAQALAEPIVSECVSSRAFGGRPHARATAKPAEDGPIVVDTTGLIERCEVSPAEDGEDGFFVTNPDGDPGILEVQWSGSECDVGSTFRFSSLLDRFQLVSAPPDRACAEPVAQHAVRLFLSKPVLAASVSADFPRGLTPVPTTLSQD